MPKPKKNPPISNKIKRQEAARKRRIEQAAREQAEAAKKRQDRIDSHRPKTLKELGLSSNNLTEIFRAMDEGKVNLYNVKATSEIAPLIQIYLTIKDKHYKDQETLDIVKFLLHHIFKFSNLIEIDLKYLTPLIESIVRSRKYWIRDITDWKPKSYNSVKQASSLIRHLFAKYEMPAFFDGCWLQKTNRMWGIQQKWYIQVAQGMNIRKASNLPFPMTKMMAHWFMKAPADLGVQQAFLWCLVLDQGGDERIARGLLESYVHMIPMSNYGFKIGDRGMCIDFDFVKSLIRWFVANPMLDTARYTEIIDYINHVKYTDTVRKFPHNPHVLVPEQPNFTIKNRDPIVMIRLVRDWHNRLNRAKTVANNLVWEGMKSIKPFEHAEGQNDNYHLYTTKQLKTSQELADEGKAMRHCVGSYASSCHNGIKSIWSLRRHDNDGVVRLLTVEIEPAKKQIVQVRGKANVYPTQHQMQLLSRWANTTGLSIASWVVAK